MSNEMLPQYDTKIFTDIWEEASDFLYDYQHLGIPTSISNSSATTLYYLLFAKYGNSPIGNRDEEQFKYKVFSVVFQYGPTWEKRLAIQTNLRALSLDDLVDGGKFDEAFQHEGSNVSESEGTTGNRKVLNTNEATTGDQSLDHTGTVEVAHDNLVATQNLAYDTKNHAFNPGTAPSGTDPYAALSYINEQNAGRTSSDGSSNQQESTVNTYDNTDVTRYNLNKADTGTITDEGTSGNSTSGQDIANNELHRVITKGKLEAYAQL